MLKRGLVLVITVLLATTMVMGVSAGEDAWEWQPAPKVIEIGAINPFTGSSAMSGELMRRGMEVALNKINAEGGINGVPVKAAYEDTKGTQDGAVAAINKLLYENKVIATLCSDYSTLNHAVSQTILAAKCPAVFGGSAWSVRELKNPWMFGTRTNDKLNAGIVAKFMVEDLKHKKISALYSDEAFGVGGFQQISKVLKEKYGIEVLNPQKFAKSSKDYTAQLLAIKKTGATCIFSWSTNPSDNAVILRQMKELGVNVEVVGCPAYGSLSITLSLAADEAEGIYAILDYTPIAEGKWVKYFNEECLKRYGKPADSDQQWPYDSCLIIAEAMRKAGVVRDYNGKKQIMPVEQARQAIREAMVRIHNFSEGTTKVYDIDANQDLAHSMVLVKVKSGAHEFVKFVEYK